MKTIFERFIQSRNPHFCLDRELTSRELVFYITSHLASITRSLKLFLHFKNPSGMLLGKNVRFFNTAKISWGNFSKLGDNVHLSALGKEGIKLGHNVKIGSNSKLFISTALNNLGKGIQIGNNVCIGDYSYLCGFQGLVIENDCHIGPYFCCVPDAGDTEEAAGTIHTEQLTGKGIYIGNNCRIGSKVTIMDGVSIGDNCIITTGSIVTKSIPANSVYAGTMFKNNNHLKAA